MSFLDTEEAANLVIDKLTKNKLSGDVIADEGSNFSLKAENKELGEYKVSSSRVLGVRVIENGHIGTSYSEATDKESLLKMVEKAREGAKYSKENEWEKVTEEVNKINSPLDELFVEEEVDEKKKVELALHLESAILDKSPDVKGAPYNGFSESVGSRLILNTNGTRCFEKEKTLSCYTSALIEKDGKNALHYQGAIARTFSKLNPQKIIDETYQMSSDLLDGGPITTGRYDVIFDKDQLPTLFGCFSMIFSGKAAMFNTNPFKDRIGHDIADKRMTITDSPLYPGFNRSYFDGEGHSTKENTLVDSGTMKTFLHNSATSKFFNVDNTFNATRGPKASLGVGGTQTVISASEAVPDSELKQGEYLEIVDLAGIHSGSDPFSGDFSFGASGFHWKNGKRIAAIRGITISGNFYELVKNIDAFGKTIHSDTYRSFFSPLIRFKEMSIAGK